MKLPRLLLLLLVLAAACGGRNSASTDSDESRSTDHEPTAPETIANTAEAAEKDAAVDPDDAIAVFVAQDGYRVGLGSYTYHLGRCDGAYDGAALQHLLGRLGESAGNDALTLSAATGVSYQEIIQVMDIAIQVGRTDVGLAAHDEMPAALLGDDPGRAANAACDGQATGVELPPTRTVDHPPVVITGGATTTGGPGNTTGSQSLTPPIALPARDDEADLDAAALIVVSREDIRVDGDAVATLADAANAGGAVPALVARLEKAKAGGATVVVLQADRATDAKVLLTVMTSAKAAGLDRILFAVNRTK